MLCATCTPSRSQFPCLECMQLIRSSSCLWNILCSSPDGSDGNKKKNIVNTLLTALSCLAPPLSQCVCLQFLSLSALTTLAHPLILLQPYPSAPTTLLPPFSPQVAFLKLYKEYDDSAWNLWCRQGVKSVAELVDADPEALKVLLAAQQTELKQVGCFR